MKNSCYKKSSTRGANPRAKLRVERPRKIIGVGEVSCDLGIFSQQVLALMNDTEKQLAEAVEAFAYEWSYSVSGTQRKGHLRRRSRPTPRRLGVRRAR